MEIIINAAKQLCSYHLKHLRDFYADSISSVRLSLTTGKVAGDGPNPSGSTTAGNSGPSSNLNDLISVLYESTIEKVRGVLQDLMVFLEPDLSFNLKQHSRGMICIEGIREHLLIGRISSNRPIRQCLIKCILLGFLKHIALMMTSFSDAKQTCPPNLHLVLSKTCLEFDKSGVRLLVSFVMYFTFCNQLCKIEKRNCNFNYCICV